MYHRTCLAVASWLSLVSVSLASPFAQSAAGAATAAGAAVTSGEGAVSSVEGAGSVVVSDVGSQASAVESAISFVNSDQPAWTSLLSVEASRTSSLLHERVDTIGLPQYTGAAYRTGALSSLLASGSLEALPPLNTLEAAIISKAVAVNQARDVTATPQLTASFHQIYLCLPTSVTTVPSYVTAAGPQATGFVASIPSEGVVSMRALPASSPFDGPSLPGTDFLSKGERAGIINALSVRDDSYPNFQEEDSAKCLYPAINGYALLRDVAGRLILNMSHQATWGYRDPQDANPAVQDPQKRRTGMCDLPIVDLCNLFHL